MASHSKKSRQARKNRKRLAKKHQGEAPVFEQLEARQLMSGSMYVGTNVDYLIPAALDSGLNAQGTTVNSIAAATAPFNTSCCPSTGAPTTAMRLRQAPPLT
ncbi:MAG: hypothetical protein V3V20_10325 [Algisphaera sp.]